MPVFDTPEPIAVDLDIGVGDVRVTATDRSDTVVEVRPSDDSKPDDVSAASQTRVEFARGCLTVKAPQVLEALHALQRRRLGRRQHRAADRLVAARRGCAGRVARQRPPRRDELQERHGRHRHRRHRRAGVAHGSRCDQRRPRRRRRHITTGSGALRVDSIDGTALLKNSNGATWVGDVSGDLRVNAANGEIAVDRAHAGVVAKTANGDVRLGEVSSGAVVAETAYGGIEIGVSDGSAAWLDLNTGYGGVDSDLEAADGPTAGQETVEVRARSGAGSITIRRRVQS